MRVLLVLLMLPMAAAQPLIFEDASGDVIYESGGSQQPAVAPHEDIDIVALSIGDEQLESFNLTLTYAGTSQASLAQRFVSFSYGGMAYQVAWVGCGGFSGDLALQAYSSAAKKFTTVGCAEYARDGATTRYQIPKDAIVDLDGLPLGFGSTLDGFAASTRDMVVLSPVGTGTVEAIDVAPDIGTFAGNFTLQLGEGGFGDYVFSTPSALRASNGGHDTFVYPVTLGEATTDTLFTFEAKGVPNQWTVRFPDQVLVQAGERIQVPVIVTTAAAHAHGGTQTFTLGVSDGELDGALELGIHYLDIPQLAGHHSMLYFHSAPFLEAGAFAPLIDARSAWFNTAEEDDRADDAPIPAAPGQWSGTREGAWRIPLDPQLLIGMDFETDEPGTVSMTFQSDDSIGDMEIRGRLMHCNPDAADGEAAGQ